MSLPSTIVIVDFGGQYAHLIARRVKDLGVNSSIINSEHTGGLQKNSEIGGIILSGGPRSVNDIGGPELSQVLQNIIIERKLPILGICYGHQLLGKYLGGKISQERNREYGQTKVLIKKKSAIYNFSAGTNITAWMSHGDHVSEVGKDITVLASSESCPVVAMQTLDNKIFSVQYHPEVTHTEGGTELLSNFLFGICKMPSNSWSIKKYKESLVEELRQVIGNERVILGVSGGVDSLVASLILKEAIGDNLYPVFINHGMLRFEEELFVVDLFSNRLDFKNFQYVDASALFLGKLKGVEDPEAKRKIIGVTFIEVFEKKAKELSEKEGGFKYFAQGTIYSDRIESGATGFGSSKIKSHHNLSLPQRMDMEMIEPLKDLYKDEVRELGIVLNAEKDLVFRYPFPGPGLAIRILGDVTMDKVKVLQIADKIFLDALLSSPHKNEVWQAFAVLLKGKAVGVQGDERTYGNIIALRAVNSTDGMTADFSKLPMEFLSNISTKILNTQPEVTRVLYDISTKPPSTIEYE